MNTSVHIPVLLEEVINALAPAGEGTYIDATLGGGGHAFAILERIAGSMVLGIDADAETLQRVDTDITDRRLQKRFSVVHGNFRDLATHVHQQGLTNVRGVLFDFGFSSMEVADPLRGLSFQIDGPLDMRFDQERQTRTAADIVNAASPDELVALLRDFGEERRARPIVNAIIDRRKTKPFTTTLDLAETIGTVVKRTGKSHPATKTFQALRIAVNDELGAIAAALPEAVALLAPGGRLVTIAFHSLEDRIVKQFVRDEVKKGAIRILTKHVVKPTRTEALANRRSRSARMRVVEKI